MDIEKAKKIGASDKINVLNGTPKENFGGFWIRLCALFIDGIIILLICTPVLFILGINPIALLMAPNITEVQVTSLTITGIYTIYLTATRGATLGKQAVKLKVIRIDGFVLGYPHASIRWIVPTIILLALSYLNLAIFWFIASIICLIAHPQRRTLHDLIAGTAVIKLSPPKKTPRNTESDSQIIPPPQ